MSKEYYKYVKNHIKAVNMKGGHNNMPSKEDIKTPTLKNDAERFWYSELYANWEDIEKSKILAGNGQPLVKIQRLKGTDIMRLVAYRSESPICPEGYCDYVAFRLDKNGNFKYCNPNDVLERLKELGI